MIILANSPWHRFFEIGSFSGTAEFNGGEASGKRSLFRKAYLKPFKQIFLHHPPTNLRIEPTCEVAWKHWFLKEAQCGGWVRPGQSSAD